MAATFAVPAGILAARVGERTTGALGGLLFAAGGVLVDLAPRPRPDYAGAFLPGMLVGGAGVGFVIPSVTSAATSSLPPDRFATGSAVLSMSRQIGVALGIAVLVSILGTPPSPEAALDAFKDGYSFMLGAPWRPLPPRRRSAGSGFPTRRSPSPRNRPPPLAPDSFVRPWRTR